jgi:hypothetical protein
MGFVRQEFRIIRTIDMSGGFVDDPDWVDTFDATAARAAGSVTMVPKVSGVIELVYGFTDGAGDQIDSEPPTRMDMHVIFLGAGSDEGPGNRAIWEHEECPNHSSLIPCQVTKPLVGTTYVAIRAKNLISPPAGAQGIVILGRVG